MELYIVRHGKTVWNQAGLIQGSSDVELLPEGIEMARQTGEGLKTVLFDAIYSSPLSRAMDTARLIRGDRRMDIFADRRLTEMDFGVCEGMKYMSKSEAEKLTRQGKGKSDDGKSGLLLEGFWDSPDTYEPPEKGESFYQVCDRAADFLKYIESRHEQNQRILIVAHAAMNQALFTQLEGLEVSDFWKYGKQLNCAVTIAERSSGKWSIRERNKIFYKL